MGFVTVYDKRTGAKHRIPEHWLGTRLAAGYNKTPRTKAAEKATEDKTTDTTETKG